jgi:hypothetical protein
MEIIRWAALSRLLNEQRSLAVVPWRRRAA